MSSSIERAAWRLAWLALAAGACAPSCGSNGGGASGAGGMIATSSATVSTNVGPTGGGCASDKPDPALGVPDGWARPPGSPCGCDVYISPDAAHMRPPSPWTDCGEGCLELLNDWDNEKKYGFVTGKGASSTRGRYFGYKRLKPGGPDELQIVRLPENKVVFDAFQATDKAFSWRTYMLRMSTDLALIELAQSETNNSAVNWLIYAVALGNAVPTLSYHSSNSLTSFEATISQKLWALTFQPPYSLAWHGSAPSNDLKPAYDTKGSGLVDGLQAIGANVFFHEHTNTVDHILVFDPVGGARKLVTFSSALEGGACGPFTDGKDMVWFQGGPISGGVYSDVKLMGAPFSTSTADLAPHVIRPAFRNLLAACGGVIGAGYVLNDEIRDKGGNSRMILTRLFDGYYWILPPRAANKSWYTPLYVDAEELAIVENIEGMFTVGNWTIVRRTIASLGPPRPPGSGFDP